MPKRQLVRLSVLAVSVFSVFVFLFARSNQVAAANPNTPENAQSPLGTNLNFLSDWSPEYAFVDAFKASRPWITQTDSLWNTDEADLLDLDANGWVKSLPASTDPAQFDSVATLMFTELGTHYPAGHYTVTYEGEGTIEYGHDAAKVDDLSEDGKDIVNVTPGTGIGFLLKITETDPNQTGDYIRNIRVIMPGFDETNYHLQKFHPEFLAGISQYKILRFMDWMRTNVDYAGDPIRSAENRQAQAVYSHPVEANETSPYLSRTNPNSEVAWTQRSEAADARYSTDKGVPVEVMVELANTTDADPWFNMPHQATDTYIADFAAAVLADLEADQRVYVEYSNEVWNTSFGQGNWIEEQAQLEWPDSNASPYTLRLNWFGKRSAEMCDIWENVWGEQAHRVVCVIASQAANDWIGTQMLDCPLWEDGPCHEHNVDAIAVAPYFGQHIGHSSYADQVAAWTQEPDGGLNKLFQELEFGTLLSDIQWLSKATIDDAINMMQAYATVANDRDLSLVSYEGGQHLVGIGGTVNNDDITDLFSAANRDSRMSALYQRYFEAWHAEGAEFFVHYNNMGEYNKWGNWGAREFYDEPMAAKSQAIATYIETAGCSWETCQEPANTAVASLTIEDQDPLPFNDRQVTIHLDTAGYEMAELQFVIAFDPEQMVIDLADDNNDNIVDGATLNIPAGFTGEITHRDIGSRSLLFVEIQPTSTRSSLVILNNGPLLDLDVTLVGPGEGIYFVEEASNANGELMPTISCGNVAGTAVACAAGGDAFVMLFTAVDMQSISTTTATSAQIFTSLFALLGVISLMGHHAISRKAD